jgi:hypothetical protein
VAGPLRQEFQIKVCEVSALMFDYSANSLRLPRTTLLFRTIIYAFMALVFLIGVDCYCVNQEIHAWDEAYEAELVYLLTWKSTYLHGGPLYLRDEPPRTAYVKLNRNRAI